MVFVVAAVLLTWCVCMPLHFRHERTGQKKRSLFWKGLPTLTAAAFAAAAAGSGAAGDVYAYLLLAGLCVCLAADVTLGIRFEAGGALFFLGHILYVLAFSFYGRPGWRNLALFLAAGAVLEFFLGKYRDDVPQPLLATGLRVYALALAALMAFSLPLPFLAFGRRSLLAALGATLFVVSDMTMCHNTLRKKPVPWHFFSLGIYYTAQLLLALSVFDP